MYEIRTTSDEIRGHWPLSGIFAAGLTVLDIKAPLRGAFCFFRPEFINRLDSDRAVHRGPERRLSADLSGVAKAKAEATKIGLLLAKIEEIITLPWHSLKKNTANHHTARKT